MSYRYRPQDDTGPKLLPPGEYRVEIVDARETLSKAGNPMWVFGCVLADDETRALGNYYLTLDTERTARNIADLVISTGMEIEEERDIEADDFAGRIGTARVEPDGRFHKIRWFVRYPNTTEAVPGPRTAPSGRTYTPPPAPRPAAPAPDDVPAPKDDIPF